MLTELSVIPAQWSLFDSKRCPTAQDSFCTTDPLYKHSRVYGRAWIWVERWESIRYRAGSFPCFCWLWCVCVRCDKLDRQYQAPGRWLMLAAAVERRLASIDASVRGVCHLTKANYNLQQRKNVFCRENLPLNADARALNIRILEANSPNPEVFRFRCRLNGRLPFVIACSQSQFPRGRFIGNATNATLVRSRYCKLFWMIRGRSHYARIHACTRRCAPHSVHVNGP